MKISSILILQENGRHVRNRRFRECFCLQRAFAAMDVTAHVWGLGHSSYAENFGAVAEKYNAILSLENYDTGWHPDLSAVRKPKAYWCIDAHMGVERYLAFAGRHRFDIIFNATEQFVGDFAALARHSRWLPNAVDDTLVDRLPHVPKNIPIGFCGNIVNRQGWIDHLKKRWGLRHDRMVIGPDMVWVVNRYKIHWNRNASVDINYRTFETLACGTLLLTNHTPGLDKLFTPGTHLEVYENDQELDAKIDYYLKNENNRNRIAMAGYRRVMSHHTYRNRAERILNAFDRL